MLARTRLRVRGGAVTRGARPPAVTRADAAAVSRRVSEVAASLTCPDAGCTARRFCVCVGGDFSERCLSHPPQRSLV